jgi:hypothetical protein
MTRLYVLALVALVAAAPATAQTPSLTCETSGAYRHCWNQRGDTVVTEEAAPGGYTHGHDSSGHAWTSWSHDGRTETWRTR